MKRRVDCALAVNASQYGIRNVEFAMLKLPESMSEFMP